MATIKELSNLSIQDFQKMDRGQLAKVVSQMSSAANKRIKRMEQKGQESPAYKKAMQSGGRFSVKGKTLNQLRAEYMRVRDFLGMKTSSLTGWKKVKKDFKERIGSDVDVYEEQYNDFWNFYQMYAKYMAPQIRGSDELQKAVFDIWNDVKDDDLETQIDKFESALEMEYDVIFNRDARYEEQIEKWFEISDSE